MSGTADVPALVLNIVFGLVPTFALAWSIAADHRKPIDERVVTGPLDQRSQHRIFALIYGLWALTLAMWNWMRGERGVWIVLWLVFGIAALALSTMRRSSR